MKHSVSELSPAVTFVAVSGELSQVSYRRGAGGSDAYLDFCPLFRSAVFYAT